MFSSLRYSVKQAFVQVFRNRAMSLASMFSITAMLLILGLFFVIMVNIGVGIEKAKTEFDSVSAYLEDTTKSMRFIISTRIRQWRSGKRRNGRIMLICSMDS